MHVNTDQEQAGSQWHVLYVMWSPGKGVNQLVPNPDQTAGQMPVSLHPYLLSWLPSDVTVSDQGALPFDTK